MPILRASQALSRSACSTSPAFAPGLPARGNSRTGVPMSSKSMP